MGVVVALLGYGELKKSCSGGVRISGVAVMNVVIVGL